MNKWVRLLVTYFFGIFGIHKFMDKKYGLGVLYLCTCGLFTVGWIYDVIKAFTTLFNNRNKGNISRRRRHPNKPQRYQPSPIHKNMGRKNNGYVAHNPYKNAVPKDVYVNAYSERKSKDIPSDYIVFDTETTGLEPEVDKIIELSAIKYINHEKVDEFSYLINPKVALSPFITNLTGIKNSDLRGKPYVGEVLINFFNWIEDFTLVAHNAPYDIKMITCECYRSKTPMCNNKIIDTLTLARRTFSKDVVENYKLETLKNYLGLSYGSHRALDDCEVCSAVYQIYCDKFNKK